MTFTFCSNKLKVEACEKGSSKHRKLFTLAVNYLYVSFVSLASLIPLSNSLIGAAVLRYRYATLIVFANYLLDKREHREGDVSFPEWLSEHREITKLLGRQSLD